MRRKLFSALSILSLFLLLAGGIALAQKQNSETVTASFTAVDSGTCSGSTSCAWMTFPAYMFPYNVTVSSTGSWSGTILVQTNQGGVWTTIGTETSNFTVSTWPSTGFTDVRAIMSAYTSGTAAVTIARNQILPGQSDGSIVISSSATSGSHTFTVPYPSAPVCVASLASAPPATAYAIEVTSSTTAVTVTFQAAETGTYNFSCTPAAN